jgi:hypothetical protein
MRRMRADWNAPRNSVGVSLEEIHYGCAMRRGNAGLIQLILDRMVVDLIIEVAQINDGEQN